MTVPSRSGVPPLQVRVAQGRPQVVTATPAALGRTPDNTIVVNHPLVSRRHLSIEWTPQSGWQVIDAGSTNGMYVNGVRQNVVPVPGPTSVMIGDGQTGPLLELTPTAPAGPPPFRAPQSTPFPAGPPSAPRPSMPAPAPSAPFQAQAPRFGELPDAPHLAALHQNVSAVFQVPGELRNSGREQIALSGVQTIGRTPDNDIVVSDVLASRHHARVSSSPQGLLLEDLGSVNGTFVNGQRVSAHRLSENDVVTIGNSDFVMSGGALVRGRARAQAAGGLEVSGVGLTIDRKELLTQVSFRAAPGSLTAIIGPSGAGKSTVSKIVAGLNNPTVGLVTFEGRGVHTEYEALRTRIGMVPQDDVLHQRLTLRQALRYAAELRLPSDLSTADRDQVIDGVLSELQLTEHVDTRVDKLSGGQRKRASVAMELLTGPSLLILDEPTSGLDPALDQQVMRTLRRLADAGRVVIVVTHSLTHLTLCDQVLLLAPGGKTAFCGSPHKVSDELGTTDWADIFAFVADRPDEAWNRYRHRHPDSGAPPQAPALGPPPAIPHKSMVRQMSTLARRQFRLIIADRGYLVVLLAMPVILGVLTMVLPGDKGFAVSTDPPGAQPSDPSEALQILTVLVIGAAFMGVALTVRDLVGERAIFERERAVGLRPGAYLWAKVVVFCLVATVQVAVMLGLAFALRAFPTPDGVTEPGTEYPLVPPAVSLFLAVAVTAWVSVFVGLTISALVRSSEQTMPPLVIVIMVQLVLSGGLIAISSAFVKPITWLLPTYWGYASAAQAVNLPYIAPQAYVEQVRPIDSDDPSSPIMYTFWDPTPVHTAMTYGALAVLASILAAVVYSRLRLPKR